MKLTGRGGKFPDNLDAIQNLILRLLRHQKPYPFGIIRSNVFFQFVYVAVFTAKSKHQYTTGIRMVDQICQNPAGMFLIVPHLRASIWVRKSNNSFHTSGYFFLTGSLYRLCNVVDASNCRNDPDFIANPRFSIFSPIPLKESFFLRWESSSLFFVSISKKLSQIGFHIMGMNPCPLRNRSARRSDRIAIFDHRCALQDLLQGKFVSLRNIFCKRYCFLLQFDHRSLL